MKKIFQFGENVEGYSIPVLNEREIRAAAGILFVMMLVAIQTVILTNNFLLLKYGIVIFLIDISIRVFINPKYAPTLILGRWIVRKQVPEYVGAPQKKFAWWIGFVLAITMLVLQVIVNSWSPVTGIICMICLIFLFFEAAFGICLGCKVYPWFNKGKVQHCPGEVCELKDRHDIQKTSLGQWFIVIVVIGVVLIVGYFFHDFFSVAPYDLFGLEEGH
jgi:uncharacterized membrane protein YphA (DoxX/SURF4 family)